MALASRDLLARIEALRVERRAPVEIVETNGAYVNNYIVRPRHGIGPISIKERVDAAMLFKDDSFHSFPHRSRVSSGIMTAAGVARPYRHGSLK